MIYLIGGTPRVGKSTLASLILKRNNISCIATDVIRNLLAHSSKDLNFLELNHSERPDVFFPHLFQFLKILQKKYPDYVVEGDIFTGANVVSMQERLNIKCCFLGTSNITADDLVAKEETPNWVDKLPPREQADVPGKLITWSEAFKTGAEQHGFPYFDIFPDRQKAIEAAYTYLMES